MRVRSSPVLSGFERRFTAGVGGAVRGSIGGVSAKAPNVLPPLHPVKHICSYIHIRIKYYKITYSKSITMY